MCIGGGSEPAPLDPSLTKPAPLPAAPVRADETRIQNVVAGLQAIRRQSGRSATILTGGGGALDYAGGLPLVGIGGTRLGG